MYDALGDEIITAGSLHSVSFPPVVTLDPPAHIRQGYLSQIGTRASSIQCLTRDGAVAVAKLADDLEN